MWDRLITDCHVATMVAEPDNPLGLFPNAAIGIDDGKIVRVGKRTELAGFRAKEVVACGGAWITPGWSIATPISCSAAPAPTNMRCAAPARPMRRSPGPAAASPRRSPRPRPQRRRAARQRAPPAPRADARRRHDHRDQVGLRPRHRVGDAAAECRPRHRPGRAGADRHHAARRARASARGEGRRGARRLCRR